MSWEQRQAYCGPRSLELSLTGYVDVPSSHPELSEIVARTLRPTTMPEPSGLKLKRTTAPGVETFRVGGAIVSVQIRLERDNLVVKGLLGRESSIPMNRVIGFRAIQHISSVGSSVSTPGLVNWHVVASLDGGTMVRLWEYDDLAHARFLASELNKTLLQTRSTNSPHRD